CIISIERRRGKTKRSLQVEIDAGIVTKNDEEGIVHAVNLKCGNSTDTSYNRIHGRGQTTQFAAEAVVRRGRGEENLDQFLYSGDGEGGGDVVELETGRLSAEGSPSEESTVGEERETLHGSILSAHSQFRDLSILYEELVTKKLRVIE
ncbi:hypothetical protein PENTCL1PPCAC_2736, partial [Pristionchus entomophagus]